MLNLKVIQMISTNGLINLIYQNIYNDMKKNDMILNLKMT